MMTEILFETLLTPHIKTKIQPRKIWADDQALELGIAFSMQRFEICCPQEEQRSDQARVLQETFRGFGENVKAIKK